MRRWLWVWLILVVVLFVATGCTTVQLGYVNARQGVTTEQRDLAILVCKDQAQLAVAKREVGDFAAGFTIIGAPIAIHLDHVKQREVFTACMIEKGYTITPPA